MHEKGLMHAACPYLILLANLYILPAFSELCFEEQTRNGVFQKALGIKRGSLDLAPGIKLACRMDCNQTFVASTQQSPLAKTQAEHARAVNSRERVCTVFTGFLNLISLITRHCNLWFDYCERCQPGLWMKALLLFHQMPAQCFYTDANGLGATLASCQGSGVSASLS